MKRRVAGVGRGAGFPPQLAAGFDQGAVLEDVRIGYRQRLDRALERRERALEGALGVLDNADAFAFGGGNRSFEVRIRSGAQESAQAMVHRPSHFINRNDT